MKKYVTHLRSFNEFADKFSRKNWNNIVPAPVIISFTVFLLEEQNLSASYVESILASIATLFKMF